MIDLPWYFWGLLIVLFGLMFSIPWLGQLLYRSEIEASERGEEEHGEGLGRQSEEDV